jgi:hypothetical protein
MDTRVIQPGESTPEIHTNPDAPGPVFGFKKKLDE